jgi:uncharacterized protein YdhG (YjbR/CyaY superfamily)
VDKTIFQSVDDYLAAQPEGARNALERVRAAIRNAVPDAEEMISYNMPTYKVGGERLIYFAAWKAHFSLYAATSSVVNGLRNLLKPYCIRKGTIRFPLDAEVPVALIEQIALLTARELARRKPTKPQKTAGVF